MKYPLVCLVIRDGWGWGPPGPGNAILNAHTPHTDAYQAAYPTCMLETSGLAVGLPRGYQGNSEVGHLNIGAGRVVFQSLTRIDQAIESKEFFANPELIAAVETARRNGTWLHLMGLIQEEGVHAVTRHALAILEICRERGLDRVWIHAITDGRDTPPQSAREHLVFLQDGMERIGVGRIATVMGRYYAMDRDTRWERTRLAYDAVVEARGEAAADWREAVAQAYAQGEMDEFIRPRVMPAYPGLKDGDAVIFFNFRFDRTRQLTRALVEADFKEFPVQRRRLYFVAMTHYYDNGNFREAFPELSYSNILGEVLSQHNIAQLRIAETEKFAHVTFFFNGLRNDPFPGEDRILVPSPRVATYDLQPEMSALEVRDRLVEDIDHLRHRAVIVNFANCDMVGHTGNYAAIVRAVETVDECVHRVVEAVLAQGGACLVTADHGNAEQTRLEDGSPMTAHTTNPVPLTLVAESAPRLRSTGTLADIAPSFLELLGLQPPEEMTGKSLLVPAEGKGQ
ncbi:MAG: 2,3-bisphosphoglycerate-independent phosphoglycerate mutase [Acidobacteriota bacterium]|jgi:2,3-bisphosphoglycerate-independent phosphoglycerate mutase|nr:2,3-bisphosphoglycerate-independent phosphoglycerate mutase [Acidobacteriota bacterium]